MHRYDAVIAGGGLIGASIALELTRAGLRVALFDANEPGREASWASAGIISPAPESPGMIPLVPICKASAALYPDFVQLIEELSGQQVGYRAKGSLDIVLRGDAQEELSTIIAVHHGVGLKAEALTAEQACELEPALTEEVQSRDSSARRSRCGQSRVDAGNVKRRTPTRRWDFCGKRCGRLVAGRWTLQGPAFWQMIA